MQAVLLVAGQSSRFYPYSQGAHKSFTKLLGKTILEHTLEAVTASGIDDILIVASDPSYIEKVASAYKPQIFEQKEAKGMGDALLQAKDKLADEFFLIAPYHVDFQDFKEEIEAARNDPHDSVVLVREEEISQDYGYALEKNGRVTEVVEKPETSNELGNRIVGIYLLRKEILNSFKDVSESHYNFEEALTTFAQNNNVRIAKTSKSSMSLKYPWDLFNIKDYLLSKLSTSISESAEISPHARIEGKVVISDGAKIMEGATIKGPCYIGKNAYIGTNALIRNGSVIEEECVVGSFIEIKNSMLAEGVTTHSGYIGDSIIGEKSKLAGYFCTGNARIDRTTVKSIVKNNSVDTKKTRLGVIMGSGVKTGIHVSTMPGVIVGNNVTIGPGTIVFNPIQDGVTYYAKFQEVIEKQQ